MSEVFQFSGSLCFDQAATLTKALKALPKRLARQLRQEGETLSVEVEQTLDRSQWAGMVRGLQNAAFTAESGEITIAARPGESLCVGAGGWLHQQMEALPRGATLRLGALGFRHNDKIHGLALAKEAGVLATAGTSSRACGQLELLSVDSEGDAFGSADVNLWDLETGRHLRRFMGRQQGVRICGLSDDARRLLIGSNESSRFPARAARKTRFAAWLIDVPTGRFHRHLTTHEQGDAALCLGGDAWAVGAGTSILVLDAERGEAVLELFGHEADICALLWEPTTTQLFSLDVSGALMAWDVERGVSVGARSLGEPSNSLKRWMLDGRPHVVNVQFAHKAYDAETLELYTFPQGRRYIDVVEAGDDALIIEDGPRIDGVAPEEELESANRPPFSGGIFDASSGALVAASFHCEALVRYSLPDAARLREAPVRDVQQVGFWRPGAVCAFEWQGDCWVWDEDGALVARVSPSGFMHGGRVTVSADGRWMARSSGKEVHLVELSTGEREVLGGGRLEPLTFSGDGETLYLHERGELQAMSLEERSVRRVAGGHSRRIDPDQPGVLELGHGLALFFSCTHGEVEVIDVAQASVVHTFDKIEAATLDPDGHLLVHREAYQRARGGYVSTLERYAVHPDRLELMEEVELPAGGFEGVNMGFGLKGRLFLTHKYGNVYVHDAKTRERLDVLAGHIFELRTFAIDREGRHLATAGQQGTIVVWDLEAIAAR